MDWLANSLDWHLFWHAVGVRTFPPVAMVTTGIGFIGGGAIMRSRGSVHGTATAASIWNTGVIGAAIAESRFEIAIILSLLNLITLRLLLPLRDRLDSAGKAAK